MLYHLDPRQAGTGAAPDVETIECTNEPEPWTANVNGGSHWYGDTEAAALAAARVAMGFGHVADRPCGGYERMPEHLRHPSDAVDACGCTWPRSAHA